MKALPNAQRPPSAQVHPVRSAVAAPFTDDDLRWMVAALLRIVDPERIILFGSRARGGARPDSDVDLLVVESDPPADRGAEMLRLRLALADSPRAVDVLVYTSEEMARYAPSIHHVAAVAQREGKVLYARPD